MAKTATKRRAWTQEHIRTLKTMARKKKKQRRSEQRVQLAKRHSVFGCRSTLGFEFALSSSFLAQPRHVRGFLL